jgi:nucleoside-diphosphate-sugar epimerase
VTEQSIVHPMDAQAKARVQSERQWRRAGAQIFRLAGIYGPGRSVLDAITQGRGQRIHKPGHVFNRIHVEDIARALWTSMAAPTPQAIYNLADDAPAAQSDVMAYAYQLLGLPAPKPVPFEKAQLSPQALRFWAASRQVDASKIKRCHGLTWKYPTYREGLAAILQEG